MSQRITYKLAKESRDELLFRNLQELPLKVALESFLETIENPNTRLAYTDAFKEIFRQQLLLPEKTLAFCSLSNIQNIGDEIRARIIGSESTKQARTAAFSSFTSWLQRKSQGMIGRFQPSKEKLNKTFKKIREKAVTPAMSRPQWKRFIATLAQTNLRDYLIAEILARSCSRISEVLELSIKNIDWDASQLKIRVKKSQVEEVFKTCVLSPFLKDKLLTYVGDRTGWLFITRFGTPPHRCSISEKFRRIGVKADIPFAITPHVLRATGITLYLEAGYSLEEVQRISKHGTNLMVAYYDKRDDAVNPSSNFDIF